MRIDGDTTSYSGNQLTHSHTHHITKCLHEEESDKNTGAAAGIRKDTYQTAGNTVSEEEVLASELGVGTRRGTSKTGKGVGFIRGMWEALGDEKDDEKENALPVFNRDGDGRGVREMLLNVRQNLSDYIVNKWESVKGKIRIGTRSALKRFGKNQDGFTMSSDIGQQTAGNNRRNAWEKDKSKSGTRQTEQEIKAAYQADNHLMDSYSKTGEYCKINENLTYQKK